MPNDVPPPQTIPLPPVPPRIAEGGDYDRCLDMVGRDPQGASDFAAGWTERGGGAAARHCQALAALALGDPSGAAEDLDRLAADASAAPDAVRAVLAGQAAQAWSVAGRQDAARRSAAVAIALDPDDPDVLVTHATVALRSGDAPAAIGDLDRVLALDPQRGDALVLRGTARRIAGDFGGARADIDAALAIDPDDAAALLERGILRQRAGDTEGARADFERTIDLSPDTPSADLAQQDIALLDAGPDDR